MAERGDYSPICVPKDASGGPDDVDDIARLEAMAEAMEPPQETEHEAGQIQRNDVPPLNILNMGAFPDRLIPFDLMDSADFSRYQTYLENFYHLHKKHPASIGDAAAAFKCLKKENNLRMCWLALKVDVNPSDTLLSNDIYKCMLQLFKNGGESYAPFVTDAARCIAKEAGLMMMFLRKELEASKPQCTLSQDIRRWALKLVMLPGMWTPDIAGALLGVTKEAELLLDKMRHGYWDCDRMDICRSAIKFLSFKLYGFESDAPVAATEVNQPTRGLVEFEKYSGAED